MEIAVSIGIGVLEFWEITPAELNIAIKGFGKRKEFEANEYTQKFEAQQEAMIYQAFLLSRWVWQKRVDIQKFIKTKIKKEQMTDEQMFNQAKLLNAKFGGDVVNGKK